MFVESTLRKPAVHLAASGATICAFGDNPLAMLSRSIVVFGNGAGIDASGFAGSDSSDGGEGGDGGPGGGRGGDGTGPGVIQAQHGTGPGAGGYLGLSSRGGGGGFGGNGGANAPSGLAANTYGDLKELLQAGSGGGGAGDNILVPTGPGGGGGGGGVELGALDSMTFGIGAFIDTSGGVNGGGSAVLAGGGSGGGIRLHAPTISGGNFIANGGSWNGGGGRILVCNSTGTNTGFSMNVSPGSTNGESGVTEICTLQSSAVPEPGSFLVLAIASATGLVVTRRRVSRS